MSDTDTKRNFLTAHDYRGAKWVAAAAGLLGTLLALVMAFLPVERTTAKIVWPENNTVSSVVAPLVSYVATDMHVAVPCSAATALGEKGGVLLSTLPTDGAAATARGLFINATDNALVAIDRNVVILSAPRAAAQNNPACRVVFRGNADGVHAGLGRLRALLRADDDAGPRAAPQARTWLPSHPVQGVPGACARPQPQGLPAGAAVLP